MTTPQQPNTPHSEIRTPHSPFHSLLQSRKFWLLILGTITALILLIDGQISPDQFADAITQLVSFIIAAIAVEDAAAKWGVAKTARTRVINTLSASEGQRPDRRPFPSAVGYRHHRHR